MSLDYAKKEREVNIYVPSNFCPLCQTTLGSNIATLRHVESTKTRYTHLQEIKCVTKNLNKGRPYEKTTSKHYDCENCNKQYTGEAIGEHLKEHLIAIITDTPMINTTKGKHRHRGVLGMLLAQGQRPDTQDNLNQQSSTSHFPAQAVLSR